MEVENVKRAYLELEDLIRSENHVELKCREYLDFVSHVLISGVSVDEKYNVKEYRGHAGSIDYVVSSTVFDGTGVSISKAFIWELKAPQCYVFELDDHSERVRPTSDLIKAENQLMNYCDEMKGSALFLEEFNIAHPDYVKVGGIIIGCSRTYVKNVDEPKRTKLFNRACRIRRNYFYAASGMRLCTWEFVLMAMQGMMTSVMHLGESTSQ